MDPGTLIGLIGATATILAAIFVGGSALMFVNIPSLLIVVGGTIFVTLVKYPMGHTLAAFKIGLRALFAKGENPMELIETSVELANIARKEGVLGLEKIEIKNPFLSRGMQLVIDGQDPDVVKKILNKEINLTIERHDLGQSIFTGIGDSAPAMGMIGTLIGLVQMMSNMDDPKSLGPAMAVALLTTLYGAVIANAIALPIADKLAYRSNEERLNKSLILETINSIQNGLNPRVMEDLLKTYLPGKQQLTDEDEGG